MKRLWIPLAIATILAQGEEDARAGKVRELLELTGALDRIRPAFDAALDRAKQVVEPADAERARKEFGREQLAAVVFPLYAKHFDDETLDATLAFLRSPAGRKYLEAEQRGHGDATLAATAWADEVLRTKGQERESRRLLAARQCKEHYDQLKVWHLLRKRYPKDLGEMEGPLTDGDKENFTKIEPDPWGTKYVLRFEDSKPRVVCFGPDGVEGTADDIVYPEKR